MGRSIGVVTVFLVGMCLVLSGCSETPVPPTPPQPAIAPPAITKAGVLTVGVPRARPPYAWDDEGTLRGIDVDLGALIAEELGLRVEYVELDPDSLVGELSAGTIDIATSVSLAKASPREIATAGIYAAEAPGFFVRSGEASGTVDASALLQESHIGVQTDSASARTVALLGRGARISEYPSVTAAFEALLTGEVDAVACDALAGSYLATWSPGVVFASQIIPAKTLSVATAPGRTELASKVQSVIDRTTTDGRLQVLLSSHVGAAPALRIDPKDPLAPAL